MGSLSLEEFQHLKKENEKSLAQMAERREELQHRLDSMEHTIKEQGEFLRNLIRCTEKTKLTKDAIHTLIHRIDVYTDNRVKIIFAFHMNELFDRSYILGRGR